MVLIAGDPTVSVTAACSNSEDCFATASCSRRHVSLPELELMVLDDRSTGRIRYLRHGVFRLAASPRFSPLRDAFRHRLLWRAAFFYTATFAGPAGPVRVRSLAVRAL